MERSRIAAVIAGAVLSVSGLALAPVADTVVEAHPSSGACYRVIGVGHRYAVVAYPCQQYKSQFKQFRTGVGAAGRLTWIGEKR